MNRYGQNGWATLSNGFVQPSVKGSVQVQVGDWNEAQTAVVIQGAGLYAITAYNGDGLLTLQNMGYPGSLQPGLNVNAGALVNAGTFASGVGGGGAGSPRAIVELGNVTGAIPIEASTGVIYDLTLTGNVAFSFVSGPSPGTIIDFVLRIHQDAVGGHAVTWPAQGEWPGKTPFVVTATTNAFDAVSFEMGGAGNWIGYPVGNIG